MISRYLPDMVFIVMAAVIAFFLAGMPKDMQEPVPVPAPVSADAKAPPEVKSMEVGRKSEGTAIGERNIFAASGSYNDKDYVQTPMPDNPYSLIGIVQEKAGMKAIFREYTGSVKNGATGDRMIDGFRIAAVSSKQVMLKRGNEKKAFNVYGSSISPTSPASGQVEMKNLSGGNPLLIGILGGVHKKAVFKDDVGNLTILETSQSLPDGSVIARIDSRSVRLRNGKDEKDLTLYAQAFPEAPLQTVQALPKDSAPPPSKPGRRRPYPPITKADDNAQGGGQ
ncbi:MAG TPA: hypothetical protein VMT12_11705 [Syntrophales bacterium]|nr:hypothetical protein [Syntrophales bacterium]